MRTYVCECVCVRDNSANIDGRDKTVESSSNNFAIRTYVRVNKKWYCVDGDSLWILVELCVPFKFLGAEKNLYIADPIRRVNENIRTLRYG